MKRIGSLLIAAAAVALMGGTAQAGAPEGSWYVAPQVNGLWLDDARLADDDAGATLNLGRTINTNWDAELAVFGSKHDRAGGLKTELPGIALRFNRVFYREGRVNPFLSFGIGRGRSVVQTGVNDSGLLGTYGAGILIDLGAPKDDGSLFQLRGDLGARRALSSENDGNKPVDYVAGLGFQYSWGGTPARRVVDSDGDGVVDSQDKCPDTPKGDRVDAIGCSFKDEIKLPGVVFETNKAELLPESIPVLEGAIATLKRYPDLRIEVAGHTDSRGADAYNLDLSSRRAATVLKFLQDGGVTNALSSRGYGERQPVASNNTDEGRQQNRRVVLRVLN